MTTDEFIERLKNGCAVAPGAHVLAAVSGGADSVALLALLRDASARMHLTVSCAHVEHGIRGEASREDMAFVRALCGQWDIPFYGGHVDAPGYAAQHGCGLEDAARRLRYAFLRETSERIGADCIALAHHLGDQAETVLLHAGRGSSLRGLGAMRMRRGALIRPLLDTPRQALRQLLAQKGLAFCEDETNQSDLYARNRIRRQVMPRLEAACPGAQRALARLALCAQRDEDFIEEQLSAHPASRAIVPLADGAAIRAQQLCSLHDALKSRMVLRLFEAAGAQEISMEAVARVMDALKEEQAAISLPGKVSVRLEGGWLALTRMDAEIPDLPLSPLGETVTPFGVFAVRKALPGENGDGRTAQVVPARLLEGASVGTRRAGERMIPFARKTEVSLKKLMIDAGVPRAMRRSVPIIRSGGSVLWVVGLRPGEGCRAEEGEERRMIVLRDAQRLNIQKEDSFQEEEEHE